MRTMELGASFLWGYVLQWAFSNYLSQHGEEFVKPNSSTNY